VASACQFVDEPRNDALGTSIKLWRDGFGERSDLRDAHCGILYSPDIPPEERRTSLIGNVSVARKFAMKRVGRVKARRLALNPTMKITNIAALLL
jgi:hypothetical protein